MSKKPETTFINGVHRHLPIAVYSMKNHNDYIAGIPDVWYSGPKADLWVEYKYELITTPRTPVIPNLSPKQLHWIKARRAEGRSVWVIVGCKPGGVLYETLEEMEYGIAPAEFLSRLVTRQELADKITKFCV